MRKNKVTVVMAVYDGEKYIAEAAQSVLSQTIMPFECIFVDDGSHDNSIAIVKQLTKKAPFGVRIITQKNSGQAAARNAGIVAAKSEYVALIDQDDIWHDDHLETILAAIKKDPKIGMVYTDFNQIDARGLLVSQGFLKHSGVKQKTSLPELVSGNVMQFPSTTIYRRQAVIDVGLFDSRLIGYEDDDLYIRMYRSNFRAVYLEVPTIDYRIHAHNASMSSKFIFSGWYYMHKLLRTVSDDYTWDIMYSQDAIFPRFLRTNYGMYSKALAAKQYDRVYEIVDVLRDIYDKSGYTSRSAYVKVRMNLILMSHPRLLRRLLFATSGLPGFMKPAMLRKAQESINKYATERVRNIYRPTNRRR